METRINMPQGRLTAGWDCWEFCHLKLHSGQKGPGLGGNPANELRKAGTKAERDDLTSQSQRNKAPTQPSATLLQLGPGLCNHSLTVYVGDVHSAFTFINSFDPHNPGEETGQDFVASSCQRRKTETQLTSDSEPART